LVVRRSGRAVREGGRRKVIRPSRRPPARIVIGSSVVADYPEGGGVWSWYLQYLLGLRALGYDAIGIELLDSTGDPGEDERRIRAFFRRFADAGLRGRRLLLLHVGGDDQPVTVDSVTPRGPVAIR